MSKNSSYIEPKLDSSIDNFRFKVSDDKQYIEMLTYPSTFLYTRLKNHFRRQRMKITDETEQKLFATRQWDGYDSYLIDGYKIRFELWDELWGKEEVCGKNGILREMGLPVNCIGFSDCFDTSIKEADITTFCQNILPEQYVLRPYQLEAITKALRGKYVSMHISTSGGKTIISYVTFAYLKKELKVVDKWNKFLLIVPSIGLVPQTVDKFIKEYAQQDKFYFNVVGISGNSKPKEGDLKKCDCIVSTYQSLKSIPEEYLKMIKVINIDEAHTAKCETTASFLDLYKDGTYEPLTYKFGWSGSLKKYENYSEFLHNKSQLGALAMVYEAKDLIADGYAPQVKVRTIKVDYTPRAKEEWVDKYVRFREWNGGTGTNKGWYYKKRYAMERDCILKDEHGVTLITNIAASLNKNTLILYNDSKNGFGDRICEDLKAKGKSVYQISGSTNAKLREKYIEEFEASDGAYMVASYGTFAAGIDTKNLYHMIFAESFKSEDRIVQAIGRLLRNFSGKHEVEVIDVVHMLYTHTVNQYEVRKKDMYLDQNYPVVEEVMLFEV